MKDGTDLLVCSKHRPSSDHRCLRFLLNTRLAFDVGGLEKKNSRCYTPFLTRCRSDAKICGRPRSFNILAHVKVFKAAEVVGLE